MSSKIKRLFAILDGPGSREPREGDVAIHPSSGRYHDPEKVPEQEGLRYIPRAAAVRAGLESCPHCETGGRRTTISSGTGGGGYV